MGADVISRGRYECWHGCQIGGSCPGHDFAVWYREGRCYVVNGDADYRDAHLSLDTNLYDALLERERASLLRDIQGRIEAETTATDRESDTGYQIVCALLRGDPASPLGAGDGPVQT